MAGTMGRDIFDPFFVPATVGLRENQSVSQGLSLDKKSLGYRTQKPLFEREELSTENW